ncbi:MAG: FAD-dependent oxidoreductase [Pseudomonadota bacterium]
MPASPQIAIVGAGPAGCFLAQALLRTSPTLHVDVIDTLPVPYGLLRYGVATDHQGTKAVARQFARVFERQGARFFGNVHIGRDVTLDALRASYDAVVLATGLHQDRRLGVPGDDLPGVIGAGALTRALYEHPDAQALPDLGTHPVVIGNGNVAIDVVRVLLKTQSEFDGSDLGAGPGRWLDDNRIDSLTVFGRSPAASAKFDAVMIRELGKLQNVSVRVSGLGDPADDDAPVIAALREVGESESAAAGTTLEFCFSMQVAQIIGDDGVTAVRFHTPDGPLEWPATSVITAIGFESNPDLPRSDLLRHATDRERGILGPGLFGAGWFCHGPRGTIPDARRGAADMAATVLEFTEVDPKKAGARIFESLPDVVSYDGWQRIDNAEVHAAPATRVRQKLTHRRELLSEARPEEPS